MRQIFKCFQINITRSLNNSMEIIFSLIIVPVVVIAAFYAVNSPNTIEKIAVIGENKAFIQYLDKNRVSYDQLDTLPDKIDIYMRNYSGAIKNQDGKVTVISYKGTKYKQELQLISEQNYAYNENESGLDKFPHAFYLSMSILLIQAVLNMRLFISDRMNDMSKRLRMIGIKSNQYLSSYILFNWISLFIPFGITNAICNRLFFKSTIIEDLNVIFISFVVTGLFSALAILICTFVNDNGSAIMVGNIIACFTVLFSGMFGDFQNNILKFISQFMPQRISFNWVNSIFNYGNITEGNFLFIIIIFVLSTLLTIGQYNKSIQY
ncbi:ABC transporter permease [Streptococcus sanguinis]|uniref:Multidrug resistance ABC transporter permease n=1 Tax=Streptococcus sanguinis TaxID=1305 RepID=A0A2X3XK81_STRSA|nr:ABC transporter permease [Streptococcus sanguinis]EGJ44844.1 ABC superfamily ATP binding cassette transporter, permease protein [Streptococcus sanguinis SK1059]EGQ21631.1 ABC superfamily ATP binding cassette transporter, permease protein [Streptococcus sanguinis ATCC 29667]SQF35132.1 multidrug resistance ABC transporter permease [Streptococcus sanguinis]